MPQRRWRVFIFASINDRKHLVFVYETCFVVKEIEIRFLVCLKVLKESCFEAFVDIPFMAFILNH